MPQFTNNYRQPWIACLVVFDGQASVIIKEFKIGRMLSPFQKRARICLVLLLSTNGHNKGNV